MEIKRCNDCDGFGVKVDDDFIKRWQNGVEEAVAKMMAGCSCPPLDILFYQLTDRKPECPVCKGKGVWMEEERCR